MRPRVALRRAVTYKTSHGNPGKMPITRTKRNYMLPDDKTKADIHALNILQQLKHPTQGDQMQ